MERLIRFAKAYRDLGWAVQEQVDDVIAGCADEINPNALKAMDALRGFDDELDQCLDEAAKQFED